MRHTAGRVIAVAVGTVFGLWLLAAVALPASATPTPAPVPVPTSTPSRIPPGIPTDGSTYETPPASTTAKDALIIVGFSVIAMAGLVLVIRAGLKSVASEDD